MRLTPKHSLVGIVVLSCVVVGGSDSGKKILEFSCSHQQKQKSM